MAAITVQQIATSGLEPVAGTAAAALGDTVVNNGRTYIEIIDTGTTAPTVTIDSTSDCNQGFDHNAVIVIGSGETRKIGPFPINRYSNTAGQIAVTYSSETDVTIAAFSL